MSVNKEWISDPPEKVKLMYGAVCDLLREGKNPAALKVQDITARAGIGKGTAYEYFSSKEEILASALLYECSRQVLRLQQKLSAVPDFRGRTFLIMDWLQENRQQSEMLKKIIHRCLPEEHPVAENSDLPLQVQEFIQNTISGLMKDARREGVIREPDEEKCFLTFLSAMMEYAVVVLGPEKSLFRSMEDDSLRDYVYEGMIRRLN